MYAAFDSISIVNSIQSLYGFLPVKNREIPADITGNLSEYALTTEVYISTDFTDFSFNCTRLILASNQKNGLYLASFREWYQRKYRYHRYYVFTR